MDPEPYLERNSWKREISADLGRQTLTCQIMANFPSKFSLG